VASSASRWSAFGHPYFLQAGAMAAGMRQELARDVRSDSFQCEVYESNSMNLLGAILLRVGWTTDLTVLSEPCLVVRHKGLKRG
jgi:hypothetical protein